MGRKVFVTSDMSVDEAIIEVAEENPTAALLWPWFLTAFDDWGRSSASAKRLKTTVFPGIDTVTVELVEEALRLYAKHHLVKPYEVDGKRYMYIEPEKWFRYQTHIRASKRETDGSRYPAPPCDAQLRADARSDAQPREDARICTPSPSPTPSLSPTREQDTRAPGGAAPNSPQSGRPLRSAGDYTPDFEAFWAAYPRHVEKKAAFRAWKARIREKVTPQTLIAAAQNYADECRRLGTEPQFVKHASTFLGRDKAYEDYIRGPTIANLPRMTGNVARALEIVRRLESQEVACNDPG